MKSRNNRLFWTALGCSLLKQPVPDVSELPCHMQEALKIPVSLPQNPNIIRGENLTGKRGRHIYMHTWDVLRESGFSRSFRQQVFPGIELFVPFVKNHTVVIPQGFQKRVPLRLRATALVGKNAALLAAGFHLLIVAAVYEKTAWAILEEGGCSISTPDKLKQIITALDLSQ